MKFQRAVTKDERTTMILELLEAWEAAPNLRFGQLLENARTTRTNATPMYYIEDEVLLNAVKASVA